MAAVTMMRTRVTITEQAKPNMSTHLMIDSDTNNSDRDNDNKNNNNHQAQHQHPPEDCQYLMSINMKHDLPSSPPSSPDCLHHHDDINS